MMSNQLGMVLFKQLKILFNFKHFQQFQIRLKILIFFSNKFLQNFSHNFRRIKLCVAYQAQMLASKLGEIEQTRVAF